MTLIPVTRISDSVDCAAKPGAGWWIARISVAHNRCAFVHGLAHHVQDAAQGCVAHGNHDRLACVAHFLTAHQTFGRVHGDGAHSAFAKVLGHFQHQTLAVVVGCPARSGWGAIAVELHVHHGADHLCDLALIVSAIGSISPVRQSASAPEMISISSLVIAA
jgi:hypothetical protein